MNLNIFTTFYDTLVFTYTLMTVSNNIIKYMQFVHVINYFDLLYSS